MYNHHEALALLDAAPLVHVIARLYNQNAAFASACRAAHVGGMKLVTSAKTTQLMLPSGQLELTIEHDLLRGVTPPMLRWWFANLGQLMTYQGQV
jgi:hypothetical protein